MNNKTISFVNIFRNVEDKGAVTYNARFEVNGVDVSARVYEFDKTMFAPRKAKETGLVFLGSKFPLSVEFTAIRRGTKNEDVLFTNIVKMEAPKCDGVEDLEAMFASAEAPEETKASEGSDEF
jgi:hypothetical protein